MERGDAVIYLDSAATTLQKPPGVAQAVRRAMKYMSSPGRGSHQAAHFAADTAYQCRVAAGNLFDVETPEQVVFTFNATHGLNIAIKTLVRPGMTVVLTGYEHNAVTRPLHSIPDVQIKVACTPLFDGDALAKEFDLKLSEGADVAICTHVSNVFGAIIPVERIADMCRRRGVPLIVDASQSAGVLPVSLSRWGAAFIAMPGHKGLYGPQGTGLLLCGQDGEPLLEGGTGSASIQQTMPQMLPDRLEAGTQNIPGIAGLLEGIRFITRTGISTIQRQERELVRRLGEGLQEQKGIEAFLSPRPEEQTGVLSFRKENTDCEDLCQYLGSLGIGLRAGLHCAPLAHRTAGTLDTGTIRASVSVFNTRKEIDQLLTALKK